MNTEEDRNIIQEDLYVNTVIEFHPMFITPKCAKHLKSYSKNFCYKLETYHLEMTEEERDLDVLFNHRMTMSHGCEKGKCSPRMYQVRISSEDRSINAIV